MRAMASPMPLAPPVTSAARSATLRLLFLFLLLLLELALDDPAGRVARQLVEELHFARHLVAREVLLHVILDLVLGQLAGARHDERLEALAEVRVLDPDDRRVGDLG